jgi:protein-disulfide isomerase
LYAGVIITYNVYKKGGLVKKADRRFWVTLAVAAFIGACVIIGLRIAMAVVVTNNNLRKEELALSREIVKQLAEIKSMISRMPANRQERKIDEGKSPCGAKQEGGQPSKPCGAKQGMDQPKIPLDLGLQKVEGVTPGANQIKGSASAPVLMVEFSDFECPFSKKFYQETFPQIEKEYISTGKVKFAYRDFPLPFHPQAQPAAIAARCAGKSSRFWEILDKFSKSDKLEQDTISMFAKEVGLEKDDFIRCFNDPAVKNEVKKDMDEGVKYGVQGTPAFFINGRKIDGAMPFEAFKQVIDDELKKAKK